MNYRPSSADSTLLYTLIVLTALAMGVRNATVRKIGVQDLTTTVSLHQSRSIHLQRRRLVSGGRLYALDRFCRANVSPELNRPQDGRTWQRDARAADGNQTTEE